MIPGEAGMQESPGSPFGDSLIDRITTIKRVERTAMRPWRGGSPFARPRPTYSSRWLTILITLPSGARTKNLRTPHASSVSG